MRKSGEVSQTSCYFDGFIILATLIYVYTYTYIYRNTALSYSLHHKTGPHMDAHV